MPPVMIVVCQNTDIAELIHERIKEGKILHELKGEENTIRIDTKLLREAESGEGKSKAAERLRQIVDTVGKTEWAGDGEPPGKNIRCVVSVAMLSEGWDAHNVTQILGLRAFSSQLLCEQVVGRGLRRTNYDDLSEPEYVDVYGVPFEVFPVKKKFSGTKTITTGYTLVRALPDRKALEIKFPRVEGYISDVKYRIRCDVDALPYLTVHPSKEPTETKTKPAAITPSARRLAPGPSELHTRNPFYEEKRLQETMFDIASEITRSFEHGAKYFIFPQVFMVVKEYFEKKIMLAGPDIRMEETALEKYRRVIIERLREAIEPDTDAGEEPLLPVIERFRPWGYTREVLFRTKRACFTTTKSHVSHVVADAPSWEHSVAFYLEETPEVISYVRNDHLDFEIPYEFEGLQHHHRPDYLVRLMIDKERELTLILEVKGYETEKDRARAAGARKWVRAVNNHGGLGLWAYDSCKNPHEVRAIIKRVLESFRGQK